MKIEKNLMIKQYSLPCFSLYKPIKILILCYIVFHINKLYKIWFVFEHGVHRVLSEKIAHYFKINTFSFSELKFDGDEDESEMPNNMGENEEEGDEEKDGEKEKEIEEKQSEEAADAKDAEAEENKTDMAADEDEKDDTEGDGENNLNEKNEVDEADDKEEMVEDKMNDQSGIDPQVLLNICLCWISLWCIFWNTFVSGYVPDLWFSKFRVGCTLLN